MVRINGLFHLLINGVFLGVKKPTDPITFDPFTSVQDDIQVSNEKNPGWLGFIGDYTAQLYRDYNKPL